ncbi:uncharacterized protein LOC142584948 isoform X1 [Dermacentor variabilis]|uniref:uncharacterized protein LOC142584948 isoform X1 n=1 Tax=Dermacentor variabilis TaxID=34621 RepID=UPI003F5B7749
MRENRLILVAAFLLLQSGLEPAAGQSNHESTPGQFLTEKASMPYQFSYFAGGHDGSHSRHETRDANGRVSGHYTLATDEGSQRVVCYVADENGFRAWVDTNEPGTDNQDPADVSVRSTAPGTAGVPRGPIRGVCGSPPPPAGPPAQTQILVTSPPVVIPPPARKPAYVPPPAVHHQEVIVPPPVVKVYPPPVQQVVVTPPPRRVTYVPPEPPTYVEQPPVRPYVRKVVVKKPINSYHVPPPEPVKTYYVHPPQPAKTYYVPPPQPAKTYYVPPPSPPKTYYVPSQPVVVEPPRRRPPPTRRLSYQPAREEVLPPSRPTYYDTPPTPPRPASVQEVYVPSRPVYRGSSCSGYCGPKVTARIEPRPEPPSYVNTRQDVSYSVRRGPYIAPRYEPWTQSSYKTYRTYNEPPQPWRPKGDVPIGVSYKMSISRSPGGPYPWQDEVVSRPGPYYRHAQPSTPPSGPHYYRPAESAPEPVYPSRSQGGYAKNDLQDDDDDTYDFKRPSYG